MPIASQVTGARRSGGRQEEDPAMSSAENPILRGQAAASSEDGPGHVPEVRNRERHDSAWFFSYSNW